MVAINSGGEAFSSGDIDFEADQYYRGGEPNGTEDAISDTDMDTLFQSERYGQYTYEVPVSEASYDVTLYFNEMYQTEADARVFSVSVEGQPVLEDFDLFSSVGHDSAHERTIKDVSVEDGNLTIAITASVDNGTISGFAVYSEQGELVEPSYPVVAATNPNIWADVPDMSIIRVGDTYYMSSTTMHLSPGVPIMKSTDLKNWEVVNYAHKKLDAGNNALNLNGSNAYSKGTWASSIIHHEGTFYVTSFSYTTNRTYIWRTNNIEGGNWTQTTLSQLYHDASLLIDDDGRAFLAYGSDTVRLLELNSDLSGVKSGGINQVIIQSASAVAGNDFILKAEGTQIQKINGWYYVSNICWPRGGVRTQVVHRSRSLTGPYEGRVVLSENVSGAGVAQGSYVSTPEGQWYLYAFRDSGAVGRIPYLVPVTWQNNWPVANNGVPSTLNFDVEDRGVQGIIRSDEFDNGVLDIVWQWNHNPVDSAWSLSSRSGFMRITNTRTDSTLLETQNTLTQRMYGPTSTGTTRVDGSNLRNGDFAGISAFAGDYAFVAITRSNNQYYVVMVNNGTEVAREPIAQNSVYLRTRGNFRNQADQATFAYSTDGSNWSSIGNSLTMQFSVSKHFMGYKFALFNFGTQSSGGYADFDFFRVAD